MNGDIVAERMKAMSRTPILMLSAYIDLPGEALERVDRFVTKGESPKVLLATIAELLRN
jgi:DNA-binding response OmpR family regulator